MTAATQAGAATCYDLRGPDFETLLVGPITDRIIDADRMVRREWVNGFPNWAMYRCALAGDAPLRRRLLDWCQAFAIAYAHTGGLRKPDDDVALCAGRDAFVALLTTRWGSPSDELAEALKVSPKTYRKFRNAVYRRLRASMDEYWVRMQIAMRQVALKERWVEQTRPVGRLNAGSGRGETYDLTGDGNYRAMPCTSEY
jgi:hypothetical protein